MVEHFKGEWQSPFKESATKNDLDRLYVKLAGEDVHLLVEGVLVAVSRNPDSEAADLLLARFDRAPMGTGTSSPEQR